MEVWVQIRYLITLRCLSEWVYQCKQNPSNRERWESMNSLWRKDPKRPYSSNTLTSWHDTTQQYSCSRMGRLVNRSSALDVGNQGWIETTSRVWNSTSKGLSWSPFARCTRSRLFHHTVDLFEGKTLCFWNEEVGVDQGACAKTSPNEEDTGSQVTLICADHVWSDHSNNLKTC